MAEGPAGGAALCGKVAGAGIAAVSATAANFAGAAGAGAGALREVLNVWGNCLIQSAWDRATIARAAPNRKPTRTQPIGSDPSA